jgi:hypothetical protein
MQECIPAKRIEKLKVFHELCQSRFGERKPSGLSNGWLTLRLGTPALRNSLISKAKGTPRINRVCVQCVNPP